MLEITILGCGSSSGVPRPNGDWGACDPADPRNRRRRCSLLARRFGGVQTEATTVVIDTSPDFREQALSAAVRRVDAVLYTHDHADQAHGIDDLRTFAGAQRHRIPCHMDPVTRATLERRFDYVFESRHGYPAICEAVDLPGHGVPFTIGGPGGPISLSTFDQAHGPIRSVGYRLGHPTDGGVAYSSDVSDLDEATLAGLTGLDLWIVDALRWAPHPTHADVAKALGWIDRVKPRRAVLTNLHQDLDFKSLSAKMPMGTEVAHDGWSTSVDL